MSELVAESERVATRVETRRVNLIVCVFAFSLFLLLELLSWFTERGGFISIFSALGSLDAQPPVMNVDKSGLRFPIILLVWICGVGVCRFLQIPVDMTSRSQSWIAILVVLGGGFLIDGLFGEPVITRYMTAHDYTRCVPGDWARGNGKSRVWFANYVREPGDCDEHQK